MDDMATTIIVFAHRKREERERERELILLQY